MTHDSFVDEIEEGEAMDTFIAELMEPKPIAISARALRAQEHMTEWYSSFDAYSAGDWWRAEIGTDHNKLADGTFCLERDDAPVIWRPALRPSQDIADAWAVVEKVENIKAGDQDGHALQLQRQFWCNSWKATIGSAEAKAPTAPLAICRAVMKSFGHSA